MGGICVIKALFPGYITQEIQQEGYDDFLVVVRHRNDPNIKLFNEELKRRGKA